MMGITMRFKLSFIALTWFSLAVLAASFYLEYGLSLQPCPLCLMQRYLIVLLCLCSFLLSRWSKTRIVKAVLGLQLFLSLAGMYFSGRQLWLAALPADQTPACMPSLNVLIHYFPWQDVLKALFFGSGDCGKVEWHFLGISLPLWSLFYFSLVFLVSLWLMIRYKPHLLSE